jgi:hypothetical protein
MSGDIIAALVVAGLSLIGSVVTIATSASKNDLEVLRGIISELRDQIEDLESDNNDLEAWAEQLCCQVKDLGKDPVKFIRHKSPVKKES